MMMYAHAQAPIRIGIAGGGTDLPVWTKERTGFCLNLAIATYTHSVAITRPDKLVVASYSQRDVAGAATEIANGLIRESALMHGFLDGFEVHILSEMTSKGSGLGVSSSIAVSLAACFRRLRNEIQTVANHENNGEYRYGLASAAWKVEIDGLRRPIGRQDHMAAAFGGLHLYTFVKNEAHIARTFSNEDAQWVAHHLRLIELSEGHDARQILSNVKSVESLQVAADSVQNAVAAIESRDVEMLGRVLEMGQKSKRGIMGAVPPAVEAASMLVGGIRGVYGCKVAGAGGGGHLVVCCDADADLSAATVIGSVRKVEADIHGVRSEGWT